MHWNFAASEWSVQSPFTAKKNQDSYLVYVKLIYLSIGLDCILSTLTL